MARGNLSDFLRHVTRGLAAEMLGDDSDRPLVERAMAARDLAAFQAIVSRHGPMVYRVCWRVLQHPQDAEDAFQATFLILARKLRTLRKHASLASWLHGIAHRVALKARAQAAARRRHECHGSRPDTLAPDDITWGELRAALDFELTRLPDKWRLPLILCYLEGRTQDESAAQLGWSKSTLRRRLEEARAALRGRLQGRGIVWPAALATVLVSDCLTSAGLPPALVAATIDAAAAVMAGQAAATAASAQAVALTEGVLKTMLLTKLKAATAVLLVLAVAGAGVLTFPTVTAGQKEEVREARTRGKEPAAQASKPAAAKNVAADDLLEVARARRQIEEQRLEVLIKGDIRKAQVMSGQDPDGARKLLRDNLLRVLDNPDISERVRDDLLVRLVAARKEVSETPPAPRVPAGPPAEPTPDQQVAELVEAYLALPADAKFGVEGDRILERTHMVRGKLSPRSKEAITRLEALQTFHGLKQALQKNDQNALKNLISKQREREILADRLTEALPLIEPSLKKWEYKILSESSVEKLGAGKLAAGLGQLGEEGWELVAFEKGRLVLKRQK
jgi:RNA polymerase sigma factor (sigma-70 family)